MEAKERKTLLETRLRNLKRKHAKIRGHADLTDMYFEISKEIKEVEKELEAI